MYSTVIDLFSTILLSLWIGASNPNRNLHKGLARGAFERRPEIMARVESTRRSEKECRSMTVRKNAGTPWSLSIFVYVSASTTAERVGETFDIK